MKRTETIFDNKKVVNYFNADFSLLGTLYDPEKIIIITDENVHALHAEKFAGYKTIIIAAGEKNKTQSTVDKVIEDLLDINADKSCMIAGVGGGMVTDIAGYVSAIYKRGVKLALVPTTILAMTDAAIGGKNGVNVGIYKNMAGTTKQAEFLLFDFSFLDTLPRQEWTGGFAEIIKHACIKDAQLFAELEAETLDNYINSKEKISSLVERNVEIKTQNVVNDEFETGDRYLLNFGHTFGHPIENIYNLPHGYAISIGMVLAAKMSQQINNFSAADLQRLIALLQQYELPLSRELDYPAILERLKKDKKRADAAINFVLLDKIGEAAVTMIPLAQIDELQKQIL